MTEYFFFMKPSRRVGEFRPLFLLTEAAFIYNRAYGIKLSLKWIMYMAFAVMQCPTVVASSLNGFTITFFWILLTHIIKDLAILCSI